MPTCTQSLFSDRKYWLETRGGCKPTPIPTAAPALDSHLSTTPPLASQANTTGETGASNEAAKLCDWVKLKIHESCPLCMALPHYVRRVGSKQVETTRIKQNLYEKKKKKNHTSHGVNKRLRQHLMYRVNWNYTEQYHIVFLNVQSL